jgi:hypothetical protein
MWGSAGIATAILNLGIVWRFVVSFMLRALEPPGKFPG